ncbi:MAG: hypothetical protein ACI9YE_003486 [Psychroserpens sp.]|jgi:hypothetical protein
MIPKQIKEPIKSTDNIQDEPVDNFICFMKSDGSTLVNSKGVVVVGRKLEKEA